MSDSRSLQAKARQIQRMGQRGDTVLAHINPQEAAFLQRYAGGDVNPYTGLPQYGLFKSLGKIFKGVGKTAFRALPAVIGNFLGGPLGGMVAGAASGALTNKKKPWLGALQGAALAGTASHFAPKIGEHFGVDAGGWGGKLLGMGQSSLPQQLSGLGFGLPSAGSVAATGLGVSALAPKIGGAGPAPRQESAPGLGESSGLDWGKLAETGLLGAGVVGSLMSRSKPNKNDQTLSEAWGDLQNLRQKQEKPMPRIRMKERKQIDPYESERKGEGFKFFDEIQPGIEYYAAGGPVMGYIPGASGGQTDDVLTEIPEGSYVMDATTVSLLGDGNSENGAHQLKDYELSLLKKRPRDRYAQGGGRRMIKAKLSMGEYPLSPEAVESAGGGSGRKGAAVMTKFRKNLREQKGVKKFLPPKSKSIESYMR